MCGCDDFILLRGDRNGGVDDSNTDNDDGDNGLFCLRGWRSLWVCRWSTLHWTHHWLPLPVLTHALQEEEHSVCVDLFTQLPSVLKASGITDVTCLSVVTHIHVLMHSSAHAQPPFSWYLPSSQEFLVHLNSHWEKAWITNAQMCMYVCTKTCKHKHIWNKLHTTCIPTTSIDGFMTYTIEQSQSLWHCRSRRVKEVQHVRMKTGGEWKNKKEMESRWVEKNIQRHRRWLQTERDK